MAERPLDGRRIETKIQAATFLDLMQYILPENTTLLDLASGECTRMSGCSSHF